jgi:hypothetical protein
MVSKGSSSLIDIENRSVVLPSFSMAATSSGPWLVRRKIFVPDDGMSGVFMTGKLSIDGTALETYQSAEIHPGGVAWLYFLFAIAVRQRAWSRFNK